MRGAELVLMQKGLRYGRKRKIPEGRWTERSLTKEERGTEEGSQGRSELGKGAL